MTDSTNDQTPRRAAGPTDARSAAQPRRSPRAVRTAAFNRRMRGYDENEIREFLTSLADEIEVADAERTALRAEIERLRHDRRSADNSASSADGTVVDPQAVAMFSQAQQVADRVVAEAVQHAQDLMANAREQQRDILKKAHSAAELAAAKAAEAESATSPGQRSGRASGQSGEPGYERPIAEIEYVRTFARVAQVQLKSVLDALTEQVEKLGELPDMSEGKPQQTPAGPSHPELAEAAHGRLPFDQPPRLEHGSRTGPEPFGAAGGPVTMTTERPTTPWT